MSRASDKAYRQIRAMIVSGEIAQGTPLVEEALAELCGVSRTPVRDALRRLEADLLVRRTDANRCVVADWSRDDIEDAFELRAMLEGHAARRAAQRIDREAIERLRQINMQLERAIAQRTPDVDRFLEHNRAFHSLIVKMADSRRLAGLLASLIEQPIVTRTAHQYRPAELRRACGEHFELIAAFERRDPDWAQAVMVAHIRRAFHAYCEACDGRMGEAEAVEEVEAA